MFLKIEKNCSVKVYSRLLNKNNIFLEVKILKIKSHLGVINFVIPNFLKIVKHANFLILGCDNKFFLKSFSTIFKNSFLGVSRGFSSKIVMVGIAHKVKYNVGTRVLSLRLGFKYLLNFKIPISVIVRCPGRKKKNIYFCGNDLKYLQEISCYFRKKDSPNVYTGKGIFFRKERIVRKIGKIKKF